MEPAPTNTRYILELERNELLQDKYDFDRKYGALPYAFLTILESMAFFVYLYIATILIYYKKSRTKTNIIVAIWAIINFTVLLEKLSRGFVMMVGDDDVISPDSDPLSQMIAGLGRSYGTSLSIVWLYSKYVGTPKPKYDFFMYLLIMLPTFICIYFIFYYFTVDKFIYEVYGPGSDIVNLAVYLTVGFIFMLCKIFVSTYMETSQYGLMISLVNLITNFPIGLITIYLRFNLDISWVYRFHIYFVDFFLNVISCSNAFVVLFIIILYHESLKNVIFRRSKLDSIDLEQQVQIKNDHC